MLIARNLTVHIEALRDKFPIIAVMGPRQSGKTTLLKSVFPDYKYVSLENEEIRLAASQDPNGFLSQYDDKAIFDEAQRVPKLFSYLQTKTDNDRKMGQYILSGSQNYLLMESITQSLAGRVALLRLMPLSFQEMLPDNLLSATWQEAVFKGFYPAIHSRDLDPNLLYPNYLETYVERDVNTLLQVRDTVAFRRFLKRCAANAGQLLNIHSIATDCSIAPTTAKAWLSILETSHMVFTLSPWFHNFNKRIIKSPKLFFYDTGIVCNLLEMNSPKDVENYFQRGSLFENLIVAEIYKQVYHAGRRPSYYFWQDSNKNEIDLLWEKAGIASILEIKSGQTINPSFFNNLTKFAKNEGLRLDSQHLVYGGNDKFEHMGVDVRGWKEIKDLAV